MSGAPAARPGSYEGVLLLLLGGFGFVGGFLLMILSVRDAPPGNVWATFGGQTVMGLSVICFGAGLLMAIGANRGGVLKRQP